MTYEKECGGVSNATSIYINPRVDLGYTPKRAVDGDTSGLYWCSQSTEGKTVWWYYSFCDFKAVTRVNLWCSHGSKRHGQAYLIKNFSIVAKNECEPDPRSTIGSWTVLLTLDWTEAHQDQCHDGNMSFVIDTDKMAPRKCYGLQFEAKKYVAINEIQFYEAGLTGKYRHTTHGHTRWAEIS